MTATIHLTLIMGSTREGRFCDTVASWAANQIRMRRDLTLDVLDPLQVRLEGRQPSAAPLAVKERLAAADGFVVVTPEYNHGYPAPLKALIDSVKAEWVAKPVGFVSYGGMSGGLRAVEQLRQVFVELHATTVRDAVSFHQAWSRFDSSGEPHDAEGSAKAMQAMLDQLRWWALALAEARAKRPYGGPAR